MQVVLIDIFEFLILVHFFSKNNYITCHSSSFYQVLGRHNDPKKMELASLGGALPNIPTILYMTVVVTDLNH